MFVLSVVGEDKKAKCRTVKTKKQVRISTNTVQEKSYRLLSVTVCDLQTASMMRLLRPEKTAHFKKNLLNNS